MTPTEEAQQAFSDGLKSSDNPYCIRTNNWCEWAEEFGRLNDEYMEKCASDSSSSDSVWGSNYLRNASAKGSLRSGHMTEAVALVAAFDKK